MELSKERLKEIASLKDKKLSDDTVITPDAYSTVRSIEIAEMARRLLAAEEQQPVYQVFSFRHWRDVSKDVFEAETKDGCPGRVLYTAPQAPMAVHPQQGKAAPLTENFDFDHFNDPVWFDAIISMDNFYDPTTRTLAMVALELNRKLACAKNQSQQGKAMQVPEEYLRKILPDAEKAEFWFEHEGKVFFEGIKFNDAVLEACRAAMLEGMAVQVPCPFPCGRDNLNKLAIQDAAFVALSLVAGEPATESLRQAAIANNDRLLKVISFCRAAMLEPVSNRD